MRDINNYAHPLSKYSHEVSDMVQSFNRGNEIDYFHYIRIYEDRSCFVISTLPIWHIHFAEQIQVSDKFVCYMPSSPETLVFLPETFPEINQAANQFGIYNMLSIHKQTSAFHEIFGFASTNKHNKLIDYYFNHIDHLKKMVFYFKEKSLHLLPEYEANKVVLKNQASILTQEDFSENYLDAKANSQFLIKRYFCDGARDKYITQREYQCLAFLAYGCSYKQIAQLLAVSNRTIETHINNLKQKLNCRNKQELIQFYHEHLS